MPHAIVKYFRGDHRAQFKIPYWLIYKRCCKEFVISVMIYVFIYQYYDDEYEARGRKRGRRIRGGWCMYRDTFHSFLVFRLAHLVLDRLLISRIIRNEWAREKWDGSLKKAKILRGKRGRWWREGHGSEEGREEEDLSNLVKSLTIDVVHLWACNEEK